VKGRGARDAGPLGQLSLWSTQSAEQDWRVRVSERARRMTIRVFAGGRVEIVVPRWARASTIEGFVSTHRAWTERKVLELSSRAPRSTSLPERIELAASNEHFAVHYPGGSGRPRLREAGAGVLQIAGDAARQTEVRECLQDWLIAHARARFAPWLDEVAAATGLSYASLQVRRQRTRWGSCSIRGTISLNCCLLFQRPAVIRYLLVHELSHTRHMNHSQRFWRLVGTHEPDHRQLDRELVQGWQHVPLWVFGP
jgi:predicted metal-dependent hydrolase